MRVSDECAFAAAGVCCCESSVSGCMYVQVLWAYGLSWRCCDGALFVMLLQPVLQLLFMIGVAVTEHWLFCCCSLCCSCAIH